MKQIVQSLKDGERSLMEVPVPVARRAQAKSGALGSRDE